MARVARHGARPDDHPLLLAFAARANVERLPRFAQWHPGDVAWASRYGPPAQSVWRDGERAVAAGWLQGPGELWLETLDEAVVPDVLAWAEAEQQRSGTARLSVRAFDSDTLRIAAFERLGYRRSGPDAVWFERDLSGEPGGGPEVGGFRVRDARGLDPARRIAAHVEAWSDLTHLGLPKAPSDFDAGKYAAVRASPAYDPALDLVVEGADGALVGSCLVWCDAGSGVGVFEPMGVHPAYRGRGLAGAMAAEGFRRLKATGCTRARIATAHFNHAALAAYAAAFSAARDTTSWWARSLPSRG